jgi:UDP-N-acetylmuramoyl-L-alanyl-D-glutamate--2,6-diaminopimelate ligase
MEDYFQAKLLLVNHRKLQDTPIYILKEESVLQSWIQKYEKDKKSLGTAWPFFHLVDKDLSPHFKNQRIPLFLTLEINQRNLKLALALTTSFEPQIIKKMNVTQLYSPQGRCSLYQLQQKTVVIDYAHTPDALENVCVQLKKLFPQKTFHLVFGCGGNRDKGKRPLMGKISERYASSIYLTSDNSRDEETVDILQEIRSGLSEDHPSIFMIEDRTSAIKQAYHHMGDHDLLLIAGKGHEDYQIYKGVKYPYSDYDVLKKMAEEEQVSLEQVYA